MVGPDRLERGGRRAGRRIVRWVCSWRRLLGLLSVVSARSAVELRRAAQREDPVAGGLPAEVEVDRADERLERRGEQRRPDAAAALGLALAEQEVRRRGRCASASRARPGVLTIAARRADRTPSSSVGMARKSASEMARFTTASPRNSSRSLCPPAASGCSWSQLLWTSACVEQVAVLDRKPEALRQRVGRVLHRAPGRRATRRSARRCSRRRPARSGSSRHPRRRSRSRTPLRGS